jgi:hypothetical protein
MKGGRPGQTDWSRIEAAPRPEHYRDFAELARQTAFRYRDVKHFVVWNEFKGFWSEEQNRWDVERYTELYNLVYDALKSVDPTLQVGGPYLVIQGTGSASMLGKRGDSTDDPLERRDRETLEYWLAHKHGAEFLAVDRDVKDFHDENNYRERELLYLNWWWLRVNQQLRAMTSLPIWWVEDYSGGSATGGEAFQAAALASMLHYQVLGGATLSLRWQPQADGDSASSEALFSDTRVRDGGRPFAAYAVYQTFRNHFGPGTRLYRSTSSSADVLSLASGAKLLLINQRPDELTVRGDGQSVHLAGYQSLLLDLPSAPNR